MVLKLRRTGTPTVRKKRAWDSDSDSEARPGIDCYGGPAAGRTQATQLGMTHRIWQWAAVTAAVSVGRPARAPRAYTENVLYGLVCVEHAKCNFKLKCNGPA